MFMINIIILFLHYPLNIPYYVTPLRIKTVDRVKRVAYEILDQHSDKFSSDFSKNKIAFDELVLVRSKQLRNEIVGFITKVKNKESSEDTQNVVTDDSPETIVS